MNILLFGATGAIGRRVLREALIRGHSVTAVLRDPARAADLPSSVRIETGDAGDADRVAALSLGQDLVISATRPKPGQESELPAAASALLAGLRRTGVRLLLVGGAGSLALPDGSGRLVIDDSSLVPPDWRPIAQACGDQLAVCRAETETDWTYLSPPAQIAPGERTGRDRHGQDELLLDAEGRSAISFEDFAVALLDEAEQPHHARARFTVAY